MNRYKPHLPRAKLGLTAVALAVITMATLVALPAKLESARDSYSADDLQYSASNKE